MIGIVQIDDTYISPNDPNSEFENEFVLDFNYRNSSKKPDDSSIANHSCH